MLCRLEYGVYIFFSFWILVQIGYTIWFLPETRGKPLERMDEVWADHKFWGRLCFPERQVERRQSHVGHHHMLVSRHFISCSTVTWLTWRI